MIRNLLTIMETHKKESDRDEIEVEDRSFIKMKYNMEKVGYREGIEEGRNKVIQKYFDKGYIDGFKNGHLLGKLEGANRAKSIFNHQELIQTEDLGKSSSGVCVLCKDDTNISLPISRIKSNQMKMLETSINNIAHKTEINE